MKLGNLNTGDAFTYDGELMMLTSFCIADPAGRLYALHINTGWMRLIDSAADVEKVNILVAIQECDQ